MPAIPPDPPNAAVDGYALATEAARFLGLTLDPAYLDGVAANLRLLGEHAGRVMARTLPPDVEPAPVFTP